MINIGLSIRKILNNKKITIVTLSEKTKLSKVGIGKILRGETSPSIDTLNKIVEALGIDLIDLFVDEKTEKQIKEYNETYRKLQSQYVKTMIDFYMTLDCAKLLSEQSFHLLEKNNIDITSLKESSFLEIIIKNEKKYTAFRDDFFKKYMDIKLNLALLYDEVKIEDLDNFSNESGSGK